MTYFLFYNDYEGISISDSIGYFDLYALSWRDWLQSSRQLVGCIINKINYGIITGIRQNEQSIPNNYLLFQNYPNPFNPSTKIKFALLQNSQTKLIIYDLLGREIQTLINKELEAGYHEINFDASSFPGGVYFYRIQAGDFIQTKKMILIK